MNQASFKVGTTAEVRFGDSNLQEISDEEDIDKVVEKKEPKKPTSKGKYFLK